MILLLFDPARGAYFARPDVWTPNRSEALDFENLDEALEIASGMGFKHCEVVLTSELVADEIRFPVSAVSRHTA